MTALQPQPYPPWPQPPDPETPPQNRLVIGLIAVVLLVAGAAIIAGPVLMIRKWDADQIALPLTTLIGLALYLAVSIIQRRR